MDFNLKKEIFALRDFVKTLRKSYEINVDEKDAELIFRRFSSK